MNDLKQLQQACSGMLSIFSEVCQEHGLTFYLAYGSLLGAIRHKGFIPWDDDVDLFMPRQDMQEIIDNFEEWFPAELSINHYQKPLFTSYSYVLRICNPHVRFLRSIGGTGKEFDSFISIFPICGVPTNTVFREIFRIRVEWAYLKTRFVRSSNNGYGNVKRSFLENVGVLINRFFRFGKGHDIRKCVEGIDNLFKSYSYDNSKVVGVYSYGVYPMFFEREWFGEPLMMQFDNMSLPVPRGYDSILSQCYGDYMTPPPENNRKPKHSYKIIVEK